MAVAHVVDAGLKVDVVPIESGFQIAGIGTAFGVNGCLAHFSDGTQAVGVHNVVDFAGAVACFDFAQPGCDIALADADIPCVAVEFAAVHHTVGVGCLPAAAFVCTGDGGVFGRSNAQLNHLAVAFEVGMYAVACSVFIVVRFVV